MFTSEEIIDRVRRRKMSSVYLAFSDVYGRFKTTAIGPEELPQALTYGVVIDGSAVNGFGGGVRTDLLLHPDTVSYVELPRNGETSGEALLFCDVTRPDGTPFSGDPRRILKSAVAAGEKMECQFWIGTETAFYLFQREEEGKPTRKPLDNAGYMDAAPFDRGYALRREIGLTLRQLNLRPSCIQHGGGPGQNEIAFPLLSPVAAADAVMLLRTVTRIFAARQGLWADFSPKPIADRDGSGMHINFSVESGDSDAMGQAIAGILEKISDMTLFLNSCEASYSRLGRDKAPGYVSWAQQNRSHLIRVPPVVGQSRYAQLRSPDSVSNPYLAIALLLRAGLYGILHGLTPPPSAEFDFSAATPEEIAPYRRLPTTLADAAAVAAESGFIRAHLPAEIVRAYCQRA